MKTKKLKEFGADSMATNHGYDLELLVSWIENLVDEEGRVVYDKRKPSKAERERLSKAEDALQLLQETLEY